MGKSDFAKVQVVHWSSSQEVIFRDKYHTDHLKKRPLDIKLKQKYSTAPLDKFTSRDLHLPSQNPDPEVCWTRWSKDKDVFAHAQKDYMKRHLFIKSCIDRDRGLKFQVKKANLRNYTPKVIDQEVNLGMWM